MGIAPGVMQECPALTALWNYYKTVHSVSMQVAPYTPPSVWQTLLGKEMGARMEHFAAPGRELKYWVIPAESQSWSSWIEGISRNGQAVLVGLNEMDLTAEGHLPRVDVFPAAAELNPFRSRLSFPSTEPPDPRRVSEGFQKGSLKVSLKGF